jgi:SAM-dependent methyltransferase
MDKKEVEYWNQFYSNFKVTESSNFSKFVMKYFENFDLKTILDAGCGNGRDSFFFSSKYKVLGIDNSTNLENKDNFEFILSDFVDYDKKNFDIIYSRFTFHSIKDTEQERFLKSIHPGSYLCIETRSIKGKDDFRYHGDTHFRNLTDINYLNKLLYENNFTILYIEENTKFAIYKNEDPICIRVICKKNQQLK